MSDAVEQLAGQLAQVTVFDGLPHEDLLWLAGEMTIVHYGAGEVVAAEGSEADRLMVVLSGEIRGQKENGISDGRLVLIKSGQVSGLLPFSRLKTLPLTTRATRDSEVAFLNKERFPALLQRVPELGRRLVGVMSDRIREMTRADEQREKLSALGKLSAGLAHELNNPSAAARRAAEGLTEAVNALRTANVNIEKRAMAREQRAYLADLECHWDKRHPLEALDTLDRSDREEQISAWLQSRGIAEPWVLAANLVEAGCRLETLAEVGEHFDTTVLGDVITRLSASFTISRLALEIAHSTSRIHDLVQAIKEYSYMDQMPEQEIDVHQGIENTLIMLHHRLKNGVNVVRDYDRSIPRICAYGSELNQVWTNLIENAIDAMQGKGELRIRTASEYDHVIVEVIDNGPGVPEAIRGKIFEPFFTTKPVGQGTGLGLDAVRRVVEKHRGEIRLESRAGETRFQVRLPRANSNGIGAP